MTRTSTTGLCHLILRPCASSHPAYAPLTLPLPGSETRLCVVSLPVLRFCTGAVSVPHADPGRTCRSCRHGERDGALPVLASDHVKRPKWNKRAEDFRPYVRFPHAYNARESLTAQGQRVGNAGPSVRSLRAFSVRSQSRQDRRGERRAVIRARPKSS